MQEQKTETFFKRNWKILLIFFVLIIITLSTRYYGSTDIGDYADVAKYFSGDYAAKIRSSHSYLYGFIFSPLVSLFKNFIAFKILSLALLFSIIYSIYLATGKNKKALWLMSLSPVVWYMAPWINSIQLSSLLFFWAYILIKKYEKTEKLKFMFFSGILLGLSWAFWDAMLFFSIIFAISFLYNKKFYHFIYFIIFVLIGLLPKLILDNYLFGFAFMGVLRYFSGIVTAILFKGIYENMGTYDFIALIAIILFLPFFIYKLFSKEAWHNNKKLTIFLVLSFLLILKNSQIRYLLLLMPIIVYELASKLTEFQFRKQILISIIITVIAITPYLIQITNSTNINEFSSLLSNLNKIEISENQDWILQEDLQSITKEFPNATFVVGNNNDDFQILAHLYWGKQVQEFVSIQDYILVSENKTVLFEKKFMPVPKIRDRRQIWISGGISKNENDDTNYKAIKLGIGINEPINLDNFSLTKKYNILYLSKKTAKTT